MIMFLAMAACETKWTYGREDDRASLISPKKDVEDTQVVVFLNVKTNDRQKGSTWF